jgi:hypothetical protein
MTNSLRALIDRKVSISYLVGAGAAGLAVGIVSAVLLMDSAPTRSEMDSLQVLPKFHDWSGSVSLASYTSFGPYRCEDDCSGHDAGWTWAQQKRVSRPTQCEGSGSNSFMEGCLYYLEVRGRIGRTLE